MELKNKKINDLGLKYKLNINDLTILNFLALNYNNGDIVRDEDLIIRDLPILNMNKESLRKKLNKYIKIGILKIINDDKYILNFIFSKKPQDYNVGLSCDWCKGKTLILHTHHYPIPKKNGGTQVIQICPNCHYEYHFLKNNGIIKFDNYLDFIDLEIIKSI